VDPARRLGLPQIDVFAQLVVSTVLLGGIYALIAVGLTLIFGIMRVVNFAHGEFLMLGMYLAFWSWSLWRVDPYVVLPAAAVVFFVLGLVVYLLVMKGVIHASHNVQIFTTVGPRCSRTSPSSSGRATSGSSVPGTPRWCCASAPPHSTSRRWSPSPSRSRSPRACSRS
jgi:hypothetical protein